MIGDSLRILGRSKMLVLCRIFVTAALLERPAPWSRREALLVGASSGLVAATPPASAASKGGVQWTIDLPSGFEVQRQLASIVRVKTETCLLADDPTTGAQAKLILLPFGQQAGGSLDADEQLLLATYFFSPKADASAERVAATMTASAKRSPAITSLASIGSPASREAGGRRYVKYSYAAERCTGELDGGECFGSLTKRRTVATVTMSSISQYRTNTERERMKELGQSRNVDVLWLLTFSAPDAAFDKLQPVFERAAASFDVPDSVS